MILQKHKVGTIKGDNVPVTKTTTVGDIAPQEGIPKAEKRRLEEVCMSITLSSDILKLYRKRCIISCTTCYISAPLRNAYMPCGRCAR